MSPQDNESWLLEQGDNAIDQKSQVFLAGKSLAIYCLWVIDYSVRNGGDISSVDDIYPAAPRELMNKSKSLSLSYAKQLMDHYGDDQFVDML